MQSVLRTTQQCSVSGRRTELPAPSQALRTAPRIASSIWAGCEQRSILSTFAPVASPSRCPTHLAAAKGFGPAKPTKPEAKPEDPCTCCSSKMYKDCCQPYHKGALAPTPEALLRSRFSAYALKVPEYIADTTHPEAPEYNGSRSTYMSAVKSTMRQMDPRKLEVFGQEPGASADEHFITFKTARRVVRDAKTKQVENETVMEKSRFIRVKGKWFFIDSQFVDETGAVPPPPKEQKIEIKGLPGLGLW